MAQVPALRLLFGTIADLHRAAVILLLLAASATWVGTAASQPLTTAVYLDPEARDADAALAFARTRAAGANVVRLIVSWREVAPSVRPPGFDATNPDDP